MMDFSSLLIDTYTLILLIILAVSALFLMLYYGLVYLRVAIYKNAKVPKSDQLSDRDLPFVSVVLVAHNDENFLRENLVYLLEQDYPNFEVVVVDYLSRGVNDETDKPSETQFILRLCKENYPHLKIVNFPSDVNMHQGKKYPLSIGIKSAKGDIILLTDPDSVPKDPDFRWIRSMMAGYIPGTKIVLGYNGVKKEKGLLNSMVQYENLCSAASMISMTIMGHPYTGVGKNLSYRRDFFFDKGAFISHYTEPYGADDMFVNQNADKSNTSLVLEPSSFTEMQAPQTPKQWRQMRKERFATKKYYSFKEKATLSMHGVFALMFYVSLVLLWMNNYTSLYWNIALGASLLIKFTWQIIAFSRLSKRFSVPSVHFFAPLYEIYFLVSNTIFYISSLISIKKRIR